MKIAVVGGGITGSVVASELARVFGIHDGGNDGVENANCDEVVLFDQGRRGPGGGASHRSVRKKVPKHRDPPSGGKKNENDAENEAFVVLPDDDIDESAFQFDHGCQFFRADSQDMKDLVQSWRQEGWVKPWKACIGSLPRATSEGNGSTDEADFFGIPHHGVNREDVYIGVGGMHLLPRRILESSRVTVHRGTRVSGLTLRRVENASGNIEHNVWDLTTAVGAAAFHDTKESEATSALKTARRETASGCSDISKTKPTVAIANQTRVIVHHGFDAVIFTDISSSSESWHRASASIPSSFANKLPPKLRLPLFSCMIALEDPLKDKLPFDAFAVSPSSESPLWFAARSDSKPGFPKNTPAECWTLISTPTFAVKEIRETTMRDPVTGAFRPQENNYLNSVPGPALKNAFFELVRPCLEGKENSEAILQQEPLYLQAQRWGSGLPIDPDRVAPEHIEDICGTSYASRVQGSLVYSTSMSSPQPTKQFICDDDLGLYYGGDFCSNLNPGFEAAALSGLELARHILRKRFLP